MVKCVVSGCTNRVLNANRGACKRPPKRFFKFPEDPARVKVWLAALRELDRQDPTEEHLICEDHFLPEDICKKGVKSDAIPIMPPCPDGSLDMITHWGAESADEEEEEAPWATSLEVEEEEEDAVNDLDGNVLCGEVKQEPDADMESSTSPNETSETSEMKKGTSRQDGTLDLRNVTTDLHTSKRRIYDITNVLSGIKLIKKESANKIKWIGGSLNSSFPWENQSLFNGQMANLNLVEDTLDTLIKTCAQQLFEMTDDLENAAMAYVTHEDIRQLEAFHQQTVIVVKAPEETKLEVPAPTETSIQVHLKAGKGPIKVLMSDMISRHVYREKNSCFVSLEESRIKTSTLHTESASSQGT
ncbi:transcription factor E2F6 isoform X2 [Betta splendens]|uniref:Transcription factor E2F6 isoform X2 n=1 Tax=Betta splendens TaxID=158456 RepID=A0A6P7LQI4_BETSP|nr:transcription factor E2F6 isoform X2 [Betta splendens]